MKNITRFIQESFYPEYLICKAIACDDELADYLLAQYSPDCLSKGMMDKLKKYIQTTQRSIDVFALTFTNDKQMQIKELVQGLILDINNQLFICMGSGDAVDGDEFCDYTGKGFSVFKKGYYMSKGTINNEYKQELDIDDVKKLTIDMLEL